MNTVAKQNWDTIVNFFSQDKDTKKKINENKDEDNNEWITNTLTNIRTNIHIQQKIHDKIGSIEKCTTYDEQVNKNGQSELMRCIIDGNVEKMIKCIKMGSDLNRQDNNGSTPLSIACQNYNNLLEDNDDYDEGSKFALTTEQIVKILISLNVRLHIQDNNKLTALDHTRSMNSRIVSEHFLSILVESERTAMVKELSSFIFY